MRSRPTSSGDEFGYNRRCVSQVEPRRIAKVFVRVAVVDLLISAPIVGSWVDTAMVSLSLLLALQPLRIAMFSAFLWRLLAPLRAWEQACAGGREPDEAVLLAADDALQHLFPRLVVAEVVGWALTLGVPFGREAFDPLSTLLAGELVFASSMYIAGMVLSPALMFAYCRRICDSLMEDLGRQLAERRLQPPRTRRSHARELVLVSMAVVCSVFMSSTASSFASQGHSQLDRALGQERERLLQLGQDYETGVELSALDAEFEGELELRPRTQLPDSLQTQLEADAPHTPRTLVSAFEGHESTIFAAYALSSGEWLYLATFYEQEIAVGVMRFVLFVCMLTGLVGLTMYWLIDGLLRPLARLGEASRRLAEHGELEELVRAVPLRDDEVGELVVYFNAVLDMLTELVRAAREVSAGNLSVEVEHTGDLHDAFRLMVEQLREMVDRLRTTAVEVTSATSEIHASMEHQAGLAERHASEVEQANQTIYSLADAANDIDQLSGQVRSYAEANLMTIDHMVTKIEQLGEQASGIGELLEQIREVASRSDLLALNGSLEATRAGEAGRGFALVAAEMRRLAERITGVVADVRERVEDIDRAGVETVAATEQGRRLANDTADVARRISELSRAQTGDSRRASITASAMAEFVLTAAMGMTQTRTAADGLRERVAELERLTRSFKLD